MTHKHSVTLADTSEIEAELVRRRALAEQPIWPLIPVHQREIKAIAKASDILSTRLPASSSAAPVQSFSFPVLIWDAWVALNRLAREPLKLNIDQTVPVRWFKTIESRLAFVPDWIGLDADIQARLHTALSMLRDLELIQRRSTRSQDVEFLTMASGMQCLQDGPAHFFQACLYSRLPRVLDPAIDHLPDACGMHISQLQWTVRIDGASLRGLGQILSKRVLGCLPKNHVAYRTDMILAFKGNDPFVRKMGGGWEGRSISVPLDDFFDRIPEGDSPAMLGEALTYPVLLGLLETGFDSKGRTTTALSPAGCALLGTALPMRTTVTRHIHLTPAYDIFFGQPDAQAKAWLALFTDLTGEEHGVVAKLTASSIQSAIAYGIELRQILSFLGSILAQPLPANVKTTMEDWERRARPVALTNGTLLTCTDETTASTIERLAGTKIQRISPTHLFLSDRKFLPALRKKAESLGILL